MSDILQGLIINSYGRQFIVEVAKVSYRAVARGKKTEYVVGDLVVVNLINASQVQIIHLIQRRNLVYRSDHNRSKLIASNIDQLLIIVAVKPNFNAYFLNSCLISAEAEGIKPIIVINKMDLAISQDFARALYSLYQVKLGYPVISLSALTNVNQLKQLLNGKTSLLIGQSGVGKSTIAKQIIPDARVKIGEITKAQTSGCHTTTSASLYHVNATSKLIDCPGLQEFGLYHLNLESLIGLFPELRHLAGQCKFRNCRHLQEPGCVVQAFYAQGNMERNRLEFFQWLTYQLQSKRSY